MISYFYCVLVACSLTWSYVIRDEVPGQSGNSALQRRAYSITSSAGWPNAEVKYKFDSDDGEDILSDLMTEAIRHWHNGAPYLTFTQVGPNSAEEQSDVVTIHTAPCIGTSASVGFQSPELPYIKFQRTCEDPSAGVQGLQSVDYMVHDLGHILGLYHEHQRPDRDQYVRFLCQNLSPDCDNMPEEATCCDEDLPKPCCARKREFDILALPDGQADFVGAYDFRSVMQYTEGFRAVHGKATLVSKLKDQHVPRDTTFTPSKLDFERVCRLYQEQCDQNMAYGDIELLDSE